jgi:hypothetical protein
VDDYGDKSFETTNSKKLEAYLKKRLHWGFIFLPLE